MSWQSLWVLWLILPAMGWVVWLHLRGHDPPLPVSAFSALRFLSPALASRNPLPHRLRQWPLLALRLLAIVALAGAFVQPDPRFDPPRASDAESKSPPAGRRLIVLDTSLSMDARVQGVSAFALGQAQVRALLQEPAMPPTMLLAAAAQTWPLHPVPSTDRQWLLKKLQQIGPRPQDLDTTAMLATLTAWMPPPPPPPEVVPPETVSPEVSPPTFTSPVLHELILVSDFQKQDWQDLDWTVFPDTWNLRLLAVGHQPTPDNQAVTAVVVPAQVASDQPIPVTARVGNFSPRVFQGALQFQLGGQSVTLVPRVPAYQSITLTTQFTPLSASATTFDIARPLSGQVRLLNHQDALATDDLLRFSVTVTNPRDKPIVTLIVGSSPSLDAGPSPILSPAHYLERALQPWGPRDPRNPVTVRWTPIDQIDHTPLQAQVLLMVTPGTWPESLLQTVAQAIRQGAVIAYIAGQASERDALARLLDLLASRTDPRNGSPPSSDIPAAGHGAGGIPHPVWEPLGRDWVNQLQASGIVPGMTRMPPAPDLALDVHLNLADGTPFLWEVVAGQGRLLVLNVDLRRSALPTQPAFVPLILRLVEHMQAHAKPRHPTTTPVDNADGPLRQSDLRPLDPALLPPLRPPTGRAAHGRPVQEPGAAKPPAPRSSAPTAPPWAWWMSAGLVCLLLETAWQGRPPRT